MEWRRRVLVLESIACGELRQFGRQWREPSDRVLVAFGDRYASRRERLGAMSEPAPAVLRGAAQVARQRYLI